MSVIRSTLPLDEQPPSEQLHFYLFVESALAAFLKRNGLYMTEGDTNDTRFAKFIAGKSAEKIIKGMSAEEKFFALMRLDDAAVNG